MDLLQYDPSDDETTNTTSSTGLSSSKRNNVHINTSSNTKQSILSNSTHSGILKNDNNNLNNNVSTVTMEHLSPLHATAMQLSIHSSTPLSSVHPKNNDNTNTTILNIPNSTVNDNHNTITDNDNDTTTLIYELMDNETYSVSHTVAQARHNATHGFKHICNVCSVPPTTSTSTSSTSVASSIPKEGKYTCPGCSIRYCSLNCYKIHKEQTSCTGKLNKTSYIPPDTYNQTNFINDYTYLEQLQRNTEQARRKVKEFGSILSTARVPVKEEQNNRLSSENNSTDLHTTNVPNTNTNIITDTTNDAKDIGSNTLASSELPSPSSPKPNKKRTRYETIQVINNLSTELHTLLRAAQHAHVDLRFMPTGMKKHNENTSRWIPDRTAARKRRKLRKRLLQKQAVNNQNTSIVTNSTLTNNTGENVLPPEENVIVENDDKDNDDDTSSTDTELDNDEGIESSEIRDDIDVEDTITNVKEENDVDDIYESSSITNNTEDIILDDMIVEDKDTLDDNHAINDNDESTLDDNNDDTAIIPSNEPQLNSKEKVNGQETTIATPVPNYGKLLWRIECIWWDAVKQSVNMNAHSNDSVSLTTSETATTEKKYTFSVQNTVIPLNTSTLSINSSSIPNSSSMSSSASIYQTIIPSIYDQTLLIELLYTYLILPIIPLRLYDQHSELRDKLLPYINEIYRIYTAYHKKYNTDNKNIDNISLSTTVPDDTTPIFLSNSVWKYINNQTISLDFFKILLSSYEFHPRINIYLQHPYAQEGKTVYHPLPLFFSTTDSIITKETNNITTTSTLNLTSNSTTPQPTRIRDVLQYKSVLEFPTFIISLGDENISQPDVRFPLYIHPLSTSSTGLPSHSTISNINEPYAQLYSNINTIHSHHHHNRNRHHHRRNGQHTRNHRTHQSTRYPRNK